MTFKYLLAVILLFISSTAVRGQVDLNDVMPGDVIDNNTMIPDGSVINLNGGSVAAGTVLSAADFPNGVELNINNGDVGLGVEINNSTINITNGQVALGATDLSEGVNNFNNDITVTGSDFAIDGVSIAGLSEGVASNIADQLTGQDVTFSGILSDGSAFSTSIAATSDNFGPFGPGELVTVPGFVSGGATVNVTLVESIPEPSSSVLFVLASCVGLVRRRR